MSPGELRALIREKWRWLPWRGMPPLRFVVLTVSGIWLGALLATLATAISSLPPVTRHSAHAILYHGWVGLEIDRTRTAYCATTPSRIMFENAVIAGDEVPIVMPLTSQGLVWPYLGRQKFVLILTRESELPPGTWNIVESARENCRWWDFLTGGREVIYSPAQVVIP